ncbi:chorismate mutase [Streptomyces sp. JNUCC 64]
MGSPESTAHMALENDRREIDALDARIVEMLRSRRRISHRIQQRRLTGGGPRTVLARETAVIDRYRQALGPEGVPLVTDVLRLCRGPAPAVTTDGAEPAP